MHRVLVLLSYSIFVIGINGASLQLSTTFDDDATEITRLVANILSLKPAQLLKQEPFIYCQVLDRCCGDEHRVQATSLFIDALDHYSAKSGFEQAVETCVNSTSVNEANEWCLTFHEEITPRWLSYSNTDAQRYFRAFRKYEAQFSRFLDRVDFSVCSKEEKYAFICLSDQKAMEKCSSKILQKINHDLDSRNYEEMIAEIKQGLIGVDQILSAMFPKIAKAI